MLVILSWRFQTSEDFDLGIHSSDWSLWRVGVAGLLWSLLGDEKVQKFTTPDVFITEVNSIGIASSHHMAFPSLFNLEQPFKDIFLFSSTQKKAVSLELFLCVVSCV